MLDISRKLYILGAIRVRFGKPRLKARYWRKGAHTRYASRLM
jgi:hypothetical protein